MIVEKYGPIITPNKIPNHIDSTNINGPTVIKRPSFIDLDTEFIMYFSHHHGQEIRIAISNNLFNWSVLDQTILPVKKYGYDHIASPDVIVHDDHIEIFYHTGHKIPQPQKTYSAISYDGFNFKKRQGPHGYFYMRHFLHNNCEYAIAKYKNEGGIVYKIKRDPKREYKEYCRILPNMRHACINDNYIYYSNIGDSPESIFRQDIDAIDYDAELVLSPDMDFEGSYLPSSPSYPGSDIRHAIRPKEVRDPFVFDYKENKYLFYTYRGEFGIALAKIYENI